MDDNQKCIVTSFTNVLLGLEQTVAVEVDRYQYKIFHINSVYLFVFYILPGVRRIFSKIPKYQAGKAFAYSL